MMSMDELKGGCIKCGKDDCDLNCFPEESDVINQIEIWKTISDYPNYRISSFGRIKSIQRLHYCGHKNSKSQLLKEKILNQSISFEYKRVRLYSINKNKWFSVHRLVAEQFIPNPLNKPCVNHKDGNKFNNNLINLEWCTKSENNKHAFKHNLNRTVLKFGLNTRFKKGCVPWNKRKD